MTDTAAEVADRLGVTERAVRRYVLTLRDAGVPVLGTPGRYGGYQVGKGVRLPPVAFSGAEALALVMAVVDSRAGAPADSLVEVDARAACSEEVARVCRASSTLIMLCLMSFRLSRRVAIMVLKALAVSAISLLPLTSIFPVKSFWVAAWSMTARI